MDSTSNGCSSKSDFARFCSNFQETLVNLRRRRGWSMQQAAKHLGAAASSWSQWENGKRFPSFDMVHHLSVCFNVLPCTFFAKPSTCRLCALNATDCPPSEDSQGACEVHAVTNQSAKARKLADDDLCRP